MKGIKMKTLTVATIATLLSISAQAEVIRVECQTEESRTARLISKAMEQAARDSAPNLCNGCQMNSSVYNSMEVTERRFKAEARASLLKARALEAAKCPHWENAIMELAPATQEERDQVNEEFQRLITKSQTELSELKAWQVAHPQCKKVDWWHASTTGSNPSYSPEDFGGKYKGKAGECSADGRGPMWRGTEQSLQFYEDEANPETAKYNCRKALNKFGFEGGDPPKNASRCKR